jgi:DNA uptake protein ComE-like DNA-binding protein
LTKSKRKGNRRYFDSLQRDNTATRGAKNLCCNSGLPRDRFPASKIRMKVSALLFLVPAVVIGCTRQDRSPDAIREQTAHATSTAARDAKAVVQGVVEGVKQQRTININRSSAGDLKSLPGIDDAIANRIVAHRPYGDSYDLVKRHIISHDEYDRISGKIEAR